MSAPVARRILVGISLAITAGVVATAATDPDGAGRTLLFAVGSLFALAFALGPLLHRAHPGRVWAPQAVAGVALFLGTFYPLVPLRVGPLRFFDLLYFPAYALLVVWLVLLVGHIRHREALTPALDAAAVTTGALLTLWVTAFGPLIETSAHPVGLVEILYPMVDATLMALALHIAVTHGRAIPALVWLILALTLQLAVDVVFSIALVRGDDPGGLLRALSLVPYLAMALGATHPSVVEISEPPSNRRAARRSDRLTVVVVFMLVPVVLSSLMPVRDTVDTTIRTTLVTVLLVLLSLRMRQTLRALARAEDDNYHRATHDMLTGLFNRSALLDRLGHDLTATGDGRTPAVLFLDCDGFKAVNDTWGHQMGDRLLQRIAARVPGCLGEEDVFARHGGDEFVVLTRVGSPGEAVALAVSVRHCFTDPFVLTDEVSVRLTPSIGIAIAEEGQSVDDVLGRADAAMYAAKQAGRGRYALGETVDPTA